MVVDSDWPFVVDDAANVETVLGCFVDILDCEIDDDDDKVVVLDVRVELELVLEVVLFASTGTDGDNEDKVDGDGVLSFKDTASVVELTGASIIGFSSSVPVPTSPMNVVIYISSYAIGHESCPQLKR